MAKENEIDYIRQVARTEDVPFEQFRHYLANKPFSDLRCGEYLMDIAQIINFLPPPRKIIGCRCRKWVDQRIICDAGIRSSRVGH